ALAWCASVTPVTWSTVSGTLFPYTTLFRSQGLHDDAILLGLLVQRLQLFGAGLRRNNFESRANALEAYWHIPRHAEREQLQALQDRKSTRLNSSHVAISYAVLCLKKKNDRL